MHLVPGYLSCNEFFDALERRFRAGESGSDTFAVRRFALWDLTQLEWRFPLLAGDPVFLAALLEYLKHSRNADGSERLITSVLMGGASSKLALQAAAMADNVLFTWEAKRAADETQGVAIWVDRVEGRPGEGTLWFVEGGWRDRAPYHRPVPKAKDIPEVLGAEDEIKRIQALQGVSGLGHVALGQVGR
jgi:hypothetical protein